MQNLAYQALARSSVVREYAPAFREATGLSLTLIASGELCRRTGLWAHENPFCTLMTRSGGACTACLKIQVELRRRLGRKLAPQQICCFAGLTELAVPVVVGGRHVATLLGGQVFLRKPTRGLFARLSRQLHAWGTKTELRRIKREFFNTPTVSEKQFQAAVRLLTIFASQLAEHANRCLIGASRDAPSAVIQAKNFVHANASEPLRMRQAAEHVRLSRHYFCKMFKKGTGMTFTEFVTRVRVEKAESLLSNPQLRISEVADSAGFNSISQFNRVFRRYAGRSPTAYRAVVCMPDERLNRLTGRPQSAQRKPIGA